MYKTSHRASRKLYPEMLSQTKHELEGNKQQMKIK